MNFKEQESEKKLSGSYYTPQWLSDYVARWICSYKHSNILEPSCGDGIFFQSISDTCDYDIEILGMDTDTEAIKKTLDRDYKETIHLTCNNSDFLQWANNNIDNNEPLLFDAAVGNPPFIRYQYMDEAAQSAAQTLFEKLDLKFTKHTNIWLPFILACVKFLKPGGHIGMIIPAEIINVIYAQGLRQYLLDNCNKVLLIDPEDLWFTDTLQGAMLLLAEKKANNTQASGISIIRTVGQDFTNTDPVRLFENAEYISAEHFSGKWTYALLTRTEREALARIKESSSVFTFDQLADVDVGIVTGANRFFLVNDSTVKQYGLEDVAHPMFGRSEHCRGIIYDEAQHKENIEQGFPTNFLYFETEEQGEIHKDYLAIGEAQNIHKRYKCRIRKPWYKVPSVYSSQVNMLKRSNGMPRLILNRMNAYNTDTAYRISPKQNVDPDSLVYCFINTVTALSAELEGRFYGGGVLELVPSEIEYLLIPYIRNEAFNIGHLNSCIKQGEKQTIISEQDEKIFNLIPDVQIKDVTILQRALHRLQLRRQRVESSFDE